jgi:ABC-type lipoprotein release transport system permease subunit
MLAALSLGRRSLSPSQLATMMAAAIPANRAASIQAADALRLD